VPSLPWIVTLLVLTAVIVGLLWTSRAKPKAKRVTVRPRRAESARRATPKPTSRAPSAPIPRLGGEDDELEITLITAFPSVELARARALAKGEAEPAISSTAMQAKDDKDASQATRVELSYEAEAELEETTSPTVRILICAIGDSDQGRMRPRNEDSLVVFPERSLFAVADGMGGHASGDVASAVAVDVLRDAFERSVFDAYTESDVEVPRRGRELACAIQMANEAIYSLAQTDAKLQGMGTTLVAARFSPNKQRVYIGHVGDSRCYRLRGTVFRQLTSDHTMSSLGVHGPRSHDLFQAVGVGLTIAIDLIVDKPHGDDLYLLCSDGLSKMVTNDEIRQALLDESDIEAAVYGLMELANDRGGKDNITIVLVKVIEKNARVLFAASPSAR
jgi:serine/threonine protein phosphatase PrpC